MNVAFVDLDEATSLSSHPYRGIGSLSPSSKLHVRSLGFVVAHLESERCLNNADFKTILNLPLAAFEFLFEQQVVVYAS